jgi:hypothetical protein
VHKHVAGAVARSDESKALLGIKKLHSTCRHGDFPQLPSKQIASSLPEGAGGRSCLLALLSSLTLSTRCDGGRIQRFDGGGEMTDEKLERQQRERQAMRQAIANYAGPITKCPPGRTTKDRHGWPKQRTQEKARRIRNSENTPSSD